MATRKEILKSKLKGKLIQTDWGYNMTINEFAKVIGETDKSLKAVMVGKQVSGDMSPSGGTAIPNPNKITSKPFTIRKYSDFEEQLQKKDSLRFVGRASPPHMKGNIQPWWVMDDKDILKGVRENTWD